MINFYRDLKWAFTVISIVFVIVLIVNLFFGAPLTWGTVGMVLLYNVYYGLPLSLANGWLIDHQNKVFPWDQQPRKRALYGVVGSLFTTMACLAVLNFILWVVIWKNPINSLWIEGNRTFYITALIITVIVTTTLYAIGFFQEVQKEKLISAKLRQEKLASELGVLRSQVDPHFLFNSFNVLSGLIDEDKNKAQEFLSGLSKIYRYILEQRNDATSTVRDELKFAQQYLHLQKMRFEDSIQLKATISEVTLGKKIPSLSLQLLLENAIKHNGFDTKNPLDIVISEQDDNLIIRNNRKIRRNISNSNGIGLQNIADRYKLLTKKEPIIEANNEFFTVKLPLI